MFSPNLFIEQGPPLATETLGALTLGGYLRDVCERHASREAVVLAEGEAVVRWTYSDLWQQALGVAQALLARGVSKETRVGLLATNRPEWLASLFGIALAGGQCVALNTFARGAELEYQLRIADVSLLIFERSVAGRDFALELGALCPAIGSTAPTILAPSLPFLRRLVCIGDQAGLGASVESWFDFLDGPRVTPDLVDAVAAQVAPADRALVFFSSGSTAKPKGVVHSHRAAAIQCWRWPRLYGLREPVRTWTANGFFWSGNFTQAIGATLSTGGALVLQRQFEAGAALRLLAAERVTLPVAWPHQWARLAEHPDYRDTDLSALRYVGASSPLRHHPTVAVDWQEPAAAYGNTETLTYSAAHPSGTSETEVADNHGRPLPGSAFRIFDRDSGAPLPRGSRGEIAVKGATLMLGYLRQALDEVVDPEGFFRTGDGGFFDEQGRLHWQGRLNDIIKTGGANVSPLEVDAVLRELPGVRIAATVGVPHPTQGELVVACLLIEPSAAGGLSMRNDALDAASVRAHVASRLSSYKVPRHVLFLAEADFELTSTNKVKTAPLRELAIRRLAAASG